MGNNALAFPPLSCREGGAYSTHARDFLLLSFKYSLKKCNISTYLYPFYKKSKKTDESPKTKAKPLKASYVAVSRKSVHSHHSGDI